MKRVVRVRPAEPGWWFQDADAVALSEDAPAASDSVRMADTSAFLPGELVLLRIDPTQRFINEVGMEGKWVVDDATSKSKRNLLTLIYQRRVTKVETDRVFFDTPTRLPLLVADRARVVKFTGGVIREAGVESLSIGMKAHPGKGWNVADFGVEGTGAYDVHQSYAVSFEGAENCWMRGVKTYAPPGNDPDVHLLSNGVLLGRGRQVTVMDCDFRFPQYRGGGGNGYMFVLQGNDCLVEDCHAEGGRHNYDFGLMTSSGNVILDCVAKDGLLFSDFHMYLSAANLVDNVICDGDAFEAAYRPYGGTPMHGASTTQSVFWNLEGRRYPSAEVVLPGAEPWTRKQVLVLVKRLLGVHVIGTRGAASRVSAWSDDGDLLVEGVGRGETLEPRSLYRDQLARRLEREGSRQ